MTKCLKLDVYDLCDLPTLDRLSMYLQTADITEHCVRDR